MARLLAFLGLLLVAFAPHGAYARAQKAPASFFCPYGAAGLDGCGQAPQNALTPGVTGTWQRADCFGDVAGAGNGYINQWSGTATDYTHATGLHPTNHNTASCDFPIGALNTVHGDPQTANLAAVGCVYNDPGLHNFSGSPTVDCTDSVWTGTLPPLDFTANINHGCVSLNLPVNAAAGVTDAYLTDLIFEDTTGACGSGSQTAFVSQVGAHNYNLHEQSITFTSLGLAARQFSNSSFANNIYNGNGNVDFRYVAAESSANRVVGYSGPGTLALYDSAIWGWSPFNPSAHGEWLAAATVTNTNFIYHDLTQINSTSQMVFQTAPITCCLGATGVVPDFELENSMTINAFPGGATVNTTITACVGGAPPVSGVCDMTTHGSNLYVITSTGTIGTGENLSCARGGIVALGTNVSGGTSAGPGGGFNGGAGSVWGLDTEAGITGLIGSVSGNTLTITTAGTADLQVGYILPAHTGFTAATITAVLTGVGGVGTYTISGPAQTVAGGSAFTVTTIPNWMATGSFAGLSGWSMAPQTCNETVHAKGDPGGAIAGASVSAPTTMTNSTITNNIIDLVVSGGANQIIIFAPGGTVCTNKTVFGGNQDPSGFDTTATMNSWTAQSSTNCN